MTRAALYCRVSTARQVKSDPWASLPQQLQDLRALAEQRGFVPALVVEEQGSGAKADRPGWARILAAARAGEVEVIMAVAFDRLTRSERLGDFEDLKRELKGLGVRLVTAKQGEIDLSGTADAEMASDMQGLWAKGERLKTRERTTRGRNDKAAAGGYAGGSTPYGYTHRYDPITGRSTFAVNEAEAAMVREAFRRFLAGEGGPKIADDWTRRGVPVPRGPVDPDAPVAWVRRTVERLVRNPVYAGLQNWRPDVFAGVVSLDFPPLIDMETWADAQQEAAVRRVRAPRGIHPPNPLSGILRCSACGSKMQHGVRGDIRKNGLRKPYYICAMARGQHPVPCVGGEYIPTHLAEEAVFKVLAKELPALVKGKQPAAAPRKGSEVATLARELAAIKADAARLVDELLSVGDGPAAEAFRRKLAEKGAQEKALAARLAEARQTGERQTHRPLPAIARELGALDFDRLGPGTRRALFQALVLRVTIERRAVRCKVSTDLEITALQLRNEAWLVRGD